MHKSMTAEAVLVVMLACVSGTQADMVMETVAVGNVGNAGDVRSTGTFGAVDYAYDIGKYEVTAGQYAEFLNAVAATDPYSLYDANMNDNGLGCQITRNGSVGNYTYDFSGRPSGTEADWANRPVNFVSWADAARFANWMHNGQGTGDTETGSYLLNGAMSGAELKLITRGPGAIWAIPSEDEWYKAAYHKNDGVTGNYFDYPTSSDIAPGYVHNSGNLSGTSIPFADGGNDPGNYATYRGSDGAFGIDGPYYRTEVGEWENSNSPYETFDQGGNQFEWNETRILDLTRGLRGGTISSSDAYLHAELSGSNNPWLGYYFSGFRVAAVREPATIALLACGALGVLSRRRR